MNNNKSVWFDAEKCLSNVKAHTLVNATIHIHQFLVSVRAMVHFFIFFAKSFNFVLHSFQVAFLIDQSALTRSPKNKTKTKTIAHDHHSASGKNRSAAASYLHHSKHFSVQNRCVHLGSFASIESIEKHQLLAATKLMCFCVRQKKERKTKRNQLHKHTHTQTLWFVIDCARVVISAAIVCILSEIQKNKIDNKQLHRTP